MPQHEGGERDQASGDAARRRAARTASPAHPLLALQRQAGNRAVSALVGRGGLTSVQRVPSGGGTMAPPQPDLATVVQQVVGGLPASLDERGIVGSGELEEGRRQASNAQDQVADLEAEQVEPGHEDRGGVVDVEGVREQVREMQEAGGARDEEPAPPSRWQRFSSWVGGGLKSAGSAIGGGLSSAWGSLKRRFGSKEGRRDTGGMVQGSGGTAAGITGKVSDAVATGSVTAPVSAPTLEHTHDWAGSFQSGASEVIHQVTAVAGVFFSALKAAVDARALVSSYRVWKALKEAKRLAEIHTGGRSDIVQAVDYAIRQKYQKIIKRAIGTLTALAALGAGLAILIANPVGAGLAAGIIAAIGAGVAVYKIGRFIYKSAKGTQGKERATRAQQLYDALKDPDVTIRSSANNTVWALKLNPATVLSAGPEEGVGLIMRKLKSA